MMSILYWALKKILPIQSHEDVLFFFFTLLIYHSYLNLQPIWNIFLCKLCRDQITYRGA